MRQDRDCAVRRRELHFMAAEKGKSGFVAYLHPKFALGEIRPKNYALPK